MEHLAKDPLLTKGSLDDKVGSAPAAGSFGMDKGGTFIEKKDEDKKDENKKSISEQLKEKMRQESAPNETTEEKKDEVKEEKKEVQPSDLNWTKAAPGVVEAEKMD